MPIQNETRASYRDELCPPSREQRNSERGDAGHPCDRNGPWIPFCPIHRSESSSHKVILGVLSAALLFWDLGKARLADWDEAFYAQISKEMLQSHNWLTPYW